MNLVYKKFTDDIKELVTFMTSSIWPYHATPIAKDYRIKSAYEEGYYTGEGIISFWIESDDKKIGFLRLYDLDLGTPLFDIRVLAEYSGKGIGTSIIKWMTKYVFKNYPNINRIEGNTREDNIVMRKVFIKTGFVKESHYRKAWISRNGDVHDAIGYGILRTDWEKSITTPVNWHDFKSYEKRI